MEGHERFELPTTGFEDQNSSTELMTHLLVLLTRIELVSHPYQGCVLPFNYRSIHGPAYRNRTHIHGVEDRCIIHYTKAGTGAGYQNRTGDWTLARFCFAPKLILHLLAESIRFELMHLFLNDSLANCWFNHSPNSPLHWRKAEESNSIRFLRTWFSRPVAGPSPLHYLPDALFGMRVIKHTGLPALG